MCCDLRYQLFIGHCSRLFSLFLISTWRNINHFSCSSKRREKSGKSVRRLDQPVFVVFFSVSLSLSGFRKFFSVLWRHRGDYYFFYRVWVHHHILRENKIFSCVFFVRCRRRCRLRRTRTFVVNSKDRENCQLFVFIIIIIIIKNQCHNHRRLNWKTEEVNLFELFCWLL